MLSDHVFRGILASDNSNIFEPEAERTCCDQDVWVAVREHCILSCRSTEDSSDHAKYSKWPISSNDSDWWVARSFAAEVDADIEYIVRSMQV